MSLAARSPQFAQREMAFLGPLSARDPRGSKPSPLRASRVTLGLVTWKLPPNAPAQAATLLFWASKASDRSLLLSSPPRAPRGKLWKKLRSQHNSFLRAALENEQNHTKPRTTLHCVMPNLRQNLGTPRTNCPSGVQQALDPLPWRNFGPVKTPDLCWPHTRTFLE